MGGTFLYVSRYSKHLCSSFPEVFGFFSILALGTIMLLHGFGAHIAEWVSPAVTFVIIAYFTYRSIKLVKESQVTEVIVIDL